MPNLETAMRWHGALKVRKEFGHGPRFSSLNFWKNTTVPKEKGEKWMKSLNFASGWCFCESYQQFYFLFMKVLFSLQHFFHNFSHTRLYFSPEFFRDSSFPECQSTTDLKMWGEAWHSVQGRINLGQILLKISWSHWHKMNGKNYIFQGC